MSADSSGFDDQTETPTGKESGVANGVGEGNVKYPEADQPFSASRGPGLSVTFEFSPLEDSGLLREQALSIKEVLEWVLHNRGRSPRSPRKSSPAPPDDSARG